MPEPVSPLRRLWQEDLNFLLTNRIPRRFATVFIGWFSRIENPLVCRTSLSVWRFFAPDLDLSDASRTNFRSMHECFVRELRPGARAIDPRPELLVSPCDALVGAHGTIEDGLVLQAKGMPYLLSELLGSTGDAARHCGGRFVTLRLKSSFYHRFHAPCRGRIRGVRYISGDTWNVNPIALERIERLFCRNERAVLHVELTDPGQRLTLVPVAAILVASLKLHCLEGPLDLRSRGANELDCHHAFERGAELGYFQHGSTIIVLASGGFEFAPGIRTGALVRVGEPLFTGLRDTAAATSEDLEEHR
jgi:phosphatidylserine decarboxylase